jgi:alpha-1,6-mannosyltransferase
VRSLRATSLSLGTAPVLAVVVSVAVIVATAVAGPSAAEPPLGPGGWLPPFQMDDGPSASAAMLLLGAATLIGAGGVWTGLRALRRGWQPSPLRLLGLGSLAAAGLVVVPPIGDADLESYAAYGRAAATGHDPYRTEPSTLAHVGDHIARAVEPPWQHMPSVYGPIATTVQTGVGHLAGSSLREAVALNRIVAAAGFLLTGLVVHAVSRTNERRRRAAILWSANPLLLYLLVGSGHVDALMALPLAAGIALVAVASVISGVLLGVALGVKLPAVLGLVGSLAGARRLRSGALVVASACVVGALVYLLAPAGVFGQTRRVAHFVGPTSPWRVVTDGLQRVLPRQLSRTIVGLSATALGAAFAAVLWRARTPPHGRAHRERAAALTTALALGWLLTGTYILPWYDTLAWVAVALAVSSWLDEVLLAHTAILTLAFLPGRDVRMGDGVSDVRYVIHYAITPILLAGLAVYTVVTAHRRSPDRQGDVARGP